jgi:lysophospholipase L1-like esterase
MKKPQSICIFGDSTAWGAWDMEKGGWVNRLWIHVANRDEDYVEIYNQSITGGTTETILERFEKETVARSADGEEVTALVFQTGGNDASYYLKSGEFMVTPEKFRENIQEIITRAKKITDHIMFMDLKNCDESKTVPVSWIDICYTNENIERYSKIMQEICMANGILFLNIAPLSGEDFDDGLHPNTAGHQKIFEQVKDFMITNGWI